MQKIIVTMAEMKLVGISLRTNNRTEIDPQTGKILSCIQRYFGEGLPEKIPHRKKPGKTFCVYTDYESDYNGDYTYFIGEEVESFDACPAELEKRVIPVQSYVKFTNGPGPMPQVVREPWFKIWQMTDEELGGKRLYLADFEIYDERARDYQNTVLDICVGIEEF